MKRILVILGIVFALIAWQWLVFMNEPDIIEVLPVHTSKVPTIDPDYPEPIRVVFTKPVKKEDIAVTSSPLLELDKQIREVRLRSNTSDKRTYPAIVLVTKKLREHQDYTVSLTLTDKSIFDYLFPKRISVHFKTGIKDNTLPKETGEQLDDRLFRQ